jgi:hypothetical protein
VNGVRSHKEGDRIALGSIGWRSKPQYLVTVSRVDRHDREALADCELAESGELVPVQKIA